ncbi:hypothetical protein LUZ60_015314 [Juncus effusus]|nr:hypothetical protein LUZ60_015314 [Juncus effusus]
MSQRPNRHQRRASQSVFVLPENFSTDESPATDGNGGTDNGTSAGTNQVQNNASTVSKDQEISNNGVVKKIQA